MADKYFNPFQAIDINVPVEFHEAFTRYCQTSGGAIIDQSPFPRMVDLWFLAVCVAAQHGHVCEAITLTACRGRGGMAPY